jgi:hypothetical protein
MHTLYTINNIPARSELGLLVLLPATHAGPVERVIQTLHAIAEPFRACIHATISLCADIFAALIAQLELFLDQRVSPMKFFCLRLSSILHLEEAFVILMRLRGELLVAVDLAFEVGKGVEVVEAEELLADAFHDAVIALSVCGHIFIKLFMV